MNQVINLLLTGRKLAFADGESKNISVVSNNDCFYVRLISDENLPTAVFARFVKPGNLNTDLLTDSEGMCKIPLNMLENGYFEVGFYADGFATTTVKINVLSSVVLKDGIEDTQATASQTEQLIALVNDIPVFEFAYINSSDELVVVTSDSVYHVLGYVKGDKGDKGDTYVLTDDDKTEIAEKAALIIDTSLLEALGTGVIE